MYKRQALPAWGLLTAMTRDGAYYDFDLSGTYGASVLGVLIYIKTSDDAAGQIVALRPKGETDLVLHYHLVANISCSGTYFVHSNSDGIFQYMAPAAMTSAFYAILMVIK